MTRRRQSGDDNQSYDSFLDIVANLVGILVILIMVVGVRARNAFERAEEAKANTSSENSTKLAASPVLIEPATREPTFELTVSPEPDQLNNELITQKQQQLSSTRQLIANLERGTLELVNELDQIKAASYQRAAERDELQLLVSAARQELDEKQQVLSGEQQRQLQAEKRVREAEQRLTDVETELAATRATIGSAQTLEHHPTPLAQTVFGREEHFRLHQGKLCYVPINEIVDVLQNDAQNKVWKLKETNQLTETIGPFDGFHVRYRLRRVDRRLPTQQGTMLRSTIELTRFTLIPIREELGEPLAQALSPGSHFQQRIQRMSPENTTITVWTYPESFGHFRTLKSHLLEHGFLAAARPLPDGFPISGSPDGSRSAAE